MTNFTNKAAADIAVITIFTYNTTGAVAVVTGFASSAAVANYYSCQISRPSNTPTNPHSSKDLAKSAVS
jgi:hypothetical protein